MPTVYMGKTQTLQGHGFPSLVASGKNNPTVAIAWHAAITVSPWFTHLYSWVHLSELPRSPLEQQRKLAPYGTPAICLIWTWTFLHILQVLYSLLSCLGWLINKHYKGEESLTGKKGW